jgi:hypothetical protein
MNKNLLHGVTFIEYEPGNPLPTNRSCITYRLGNEYSGKVVELSAVLSNWSFDIREQTQIGPRFIVNFFDVIVVESADGTGKIIDTDRMRVGPSLSGDYAYYKLYARTHHTGNGNMPTSIHYCQSDDTWILHDDDKVFSERSYAQAKAFDLHPSYRPEYTITYQDIGTKSRPFIDFTSTRLLFQRVYPPTDEE